MSWHRGPLAAFDTETTGVDPESDRIVTAAVSLVGAEIDGEHHAWLLDPGVLIPSGASAVHGITTEMARAEGRPPAEAVEEILDLLCRCLLDGTPIVAFNARFDLTILDREARRQGIEPLLDRVGGPDGLLVIDPLVLDKHVDRFRRGKRTLGQVCEHYRIGHEDAHDANADALAAARLAYRLASRSPELRDADLPELHACQVEWAAQQAASLEEHFAGLGRMESIERAWPIVPMPVELPLAA